MEDPLKEHRVAYQEHNEETGEHIATETMRLLPPVPPNSGNSIAGRL